MKRIFSAALLFVALGAQGGVLVSYSFDDGLTDTGPDTFAVFQHAKGHVRLVTHIRQSGYRSIELKDVAGDGDFPELQGYFPERTRGELFFHFAMLVANPDQPLNIALAGKSHFTMSKDGIGFWLKTQQGLLHHVSDSIPKRLFPIEPFVWYQVDVRSDITGGTYDLTIRREGTPKPIVELKAQPNATNTPESAVDKFSFVGSVFEDDSDVVFYVDDVVMGTDEKVLPGPFVAPGRRKLFIDRWREAKELMVRSPGCPPVLSLTDFGLARVEGEFESEPAVKEWRAACALLDRDAEAAAKLFAKKAIENPNAPIFAISELMARVRMNDRDAAMRRWNELEPLLQNDVRYGMIAAIADLDRAERWFEEHLPEHADEYYFVLLWRGEFNRAAAFAETMKWDERAADGYFLAGSPARARTLYERALRDDPKSWWAAAKLSDVHHVLGDAAGERMYRERLFGALKE